jgi:hypothetical protein
MTVMKCFAWFSGGMCPPRLTQSVIASPAVITPLTYMELAGCQECTKFCSTHLGAWHKAHRECLVQSTHPRQQGQHKFTLQLLHGQTTCRHAWYMIIQTQIRNRTNLVTHTATSCCALLVTHVDTAVFSDH